MTFQRKITGPGAATAKYDVLTAITVTGLHGAPGYQASMMRLAAMVTARYNWARNEVSIGQVELSRLWSVNERTVKREMKRLTEGGLLICCRPGVRGRVGAYRLDLEELCRQSRPFWPSVGTDFADRMAALCLQTDQAVPPAAASARDQAEGISESAGTEPAVNPGEWGQVQRLLRAQDPARYSAWFSKLDYQGCDGGGRVLLRAPSDFVGRYIETHLSKSLLAATSTVFGRDRQIRIGGPDRA